MLREMIQERGECGCCRGKAEFLEHCSLVDKEGLASGGAMKRKALCG